jgi:hypothetical protein
LKEYQEDKNKPKEAAPASTPADPLAKPAQAAAANPPEDAASPEEAEAPGESGAAVAPDQAMGMGMMGGVGAHKGQAPKTEIKYEPSAWGRYAKVLLSSTEFIFIN